jgi:integrase
MALGVPTLLLAAAQTQGTRVVALIVLVAFLALYGVVLFLAIRSFQTSVLATPRGVEVRQMRLGRRFFPWGEIQRVEEQIRGYRAHAAVLVLTTGQRIIVDATDARRAALYNGHRLRDISARSGRAVMPWTEQLIRAHQAHLAHHHPA